MIFLQLYKIVHDEPPRIIIGFLLFTCLRNSLELLFRAAATQSSSLRWDTLISLFSCLKDSSWQSCRSCNGLNLISQFLGYFDLIAAWFTMLNHCGCSFWLPHTLLVGMKFPSIARNLILKLFLVAFTVFNLVGSCSPSSLLNLSNLASRKFSLRLAFEIAFWMRKKHLCYLGHVTDCETRVMMAVTAKVGPARRKLWKMLHYMVNESKHVIAEKKNSNKYIRSMCEICTILLSGNGPGGKFNVLRRVERRSSNEIPEMFGVE